MDWHATWRSLCSSTIATRWRYTMVCQWLSGISQCWTQKLPSRLATLCTSASLSAQIWDHLVCSWWATMVRLLLLRTWLRISRKFQLSSPFLSQVLYTSGWRMLTAEFVWMVKMSSSTEWLLRLTFIQQQKHLRRRKQPSLYGFLKMRKASRLFKMRKSRFLLHHSL